MSKTFWKSLAINLLYLIVAIIGLFVIPVALPFGKYKYTIGNERLYRLPRWAAPWDNAHDGADGDARKWWDRNCAKEAWFGAFKNLRATDFMARYWWLAVRNPVNYMKRIWFGIDARECVLLWVKGDKFITDKPDNNGFYLAKWKHKDKTFYSVEICIDWEDGTAFYVQFGYKLKPSKDYSHITDISRLKSVTWEVNFKKDIS